MAHSNIGWALIQRLRLREARKHFAEALRVDPGSEYALRGMDRALLRVTLRLPARFRWALFVVMVLGLVIWKRDPPAYPWACSACWRF